MMDLNCHLGATYPLRKRIWACAISVGYIVLGITALPTNAEMPSCTENALIVFDASGSMGIPEGRERRIDAARRAIADVLPSIARSRPTGLVTYSGGSASTCSDITLRVPPMPGSAARILSELAKLRPGGPTPLTRAVSLAAAELKRLGEPGIVVLVTDGTESCMQNTCALARAIALDHPGIRIFTIGFRLTAAVAAAQDLVCLAAATGGTHATTDSVEELRTALRAAFACPRLASNTRWLHSTTLDSDSVGAVAQQYGKVTVDVGNVGCPQ